MIKLGDLVVDKVTGFKGVAVAEHRYLQGCTRFTLQPHVGEDGKLPEDQCFDEPQLTLVVHKVTEKGNTKIGGPEKYPTTARCTGKK